MIGKYGTRSFKTINKIYCAWLYILMQLKGRWKAILLYTPISKKVVFWIVALCIAQCCIPRRQSTMDVANLYILACQDRKALCSTLLPWLTHECRCLIVGTCNAILKVRYIHDTLRSGYATIRNAWNNSEDNLFRIRCISLSLRTFDRNIEYNFSSCISLLVATFIIKR